MSPIAGIDLGTTNSLIGVMDAGFPVLLADADGERLTPSVVHFPKIGEPLVGRAAARMRTVDPKHTVYSIKRFIGRRAGEEADDVAYAIAGQRGTPVRVRLVVRLEAGMRLLGPGSRPVRDLRRPVLRPQGAMLKDVRGPARRAPATR